MKPYLESVRRLSRIALILLVLSVAASMIISMQFCTQEYINSIPSLRQAYLPAIIYMFVGGIVLAMDGFSFLNKRSDSDFYHSLPVSRKRLFWSVTLAALTWIAATVLASVLISVIVFTVSHTPFVPGYALIAVPFCIVGAMLVFAAASIAMSLSGTWLTNIALTLLVLGLPRFLQFAVARGIIAKFGLLGWLDLPWYLTPVTNIVTGQLVSLTHIMLQTQLYSMVNVAYSLVLTVAELFFAGWLFKRRPSELAEHSAKNAKLQTLFACLLILPITALFAANAVQMTVTNVVIVLAVTAALYAIYQAIALRSVRSMVRSLPWALAPIALSLLLFFGVRIPANTMRYDIPTIQQVAYVEFPGNDRSNGTMPYEEYLVAQVDFSETNVKDYVLTTLRENVSMLDQYGYVYYQDPDGYTTFEPVTIVLNNGRKIKRELYFQNLNTLNTLREENADYVVAVRTLPPEDSVYYRQGKSVYNAASAQFAPIQKAYYADVESTGIIPLWSYNQHSDSDDSSLNERQSFGSLYLTGYVGTQRYVDYYEIRKETPNAAASWMLLQNENSTGEYFDVLKEMCTHADSFLSTSDYINCEFAFYNVPLSNGNKQFKSIYYNRSATDTTVLNSSYESLANELIDIISRSEPTTDPDALSVYVTWSGRVVDEAGDYVGADVIAQQMASSGDATKSGSKSLFSSWGDVVYYSSDGNGTFSVNDGTVVSYNPSYRSFSAADEARVVELLKEWQELQKELQFNYSAYDYNSYDYNAEDYIIASPNTIYATPTPMP